MDRTRRIELRLRHQVEVGEAANYLLGKLDCDTWWVACQREHLVVVNLSKFSRHRYAIRFECTAPVEKAIYHGSKAWSLSIIPLEGEPDLPPDLIAEIKAGLVRLEEVSAGNALRTHQE